MFFVERFCFGIVSVKFGIFVSVVIAPNISANKLCSNKTELNDETYSVKVTMNSSIKLLQSTLCHTLPEFTEHARDQIANVAGEAIVKTLR